MLSTVYRCGHNIKWKKTTISGHGYKEETRAKLEFSMPFSNSVVPNYSKLAILISMTFYMFNSVICERTILDM